MESSALVYILLTAIVVAFGWTVRNGDRIQLTGYHGRNRQQAFNEVAESAIFCLLAGVSACRIAVGGD